MFNSLVIPQTPTNSALSTKENSPGESKPTVPADDPDERSVFVKNVHFKTNVSDLKEHFKECGNIVRITIPVDKASGQSKG